MISVAIRDEFIKLGQAMKLCGAVESGAEAKEVITEELVRDVYEVEATVGLDKEGEIYVLPKRFIGDYHL